MKKKVKPKKIKPKKIIKETYDYVELRFNQFDSDKAYNTHIDAKFVRQLFDSAMAKTRYDSYDEESKYTFQINRSRYIFYIMRLLDVMSVVELNMLTQQVINYRPTLTVDKFTHEVDEIFDIFEVKAKEKDIRMNVIGVAIITMYAEMPRLLKGYDDAIMRIDYANVMSDLMHALVDEFGHALND